MISHSDWVTAVWSTTIPVLMAFCALALWLGMKLRTEEEDVDIFITAREKVGSWRTTWAFFAGVLGSWVVTRPGYMAASTGVFGLCMYSLSVGLAILIVCFFGVLIMQRIDQPTSLGDFFRWRFGPVAQIYIVVLVVFNMTVLLLAEYTNIISVFEDFVGTGYFAVVISVGLLALIYTTYAGLFTSIITNQFQSLTVIALTIAVSAYLGTNFDRDLPKSLTPKQTGFNQLGVSSIVVFPLAVLSSSLFTESLWQRCWACSNPRKLMGSSSLSAVLVCIFTFIMGFLALLGQWTSPKPTIDPPPKAVISVPSSYHPYYTFFQALPKKPSASFPTRLDNWAGVVTVLITVVLSQSHVAALQSGISATLSAYLLEDSPLFVTRTIALLVNIPILSIALRNVAISNVFHLANMLCALSMMPAFLGLMPALYRWYTGDMMFYAVLLGFLGSSGYGISQVYDSADKGSSLQSGLELMWWNERYSYKRTLAIVSCSMIGVLITMIFGLPFTACGLHVGSLSDVIASIQERTTSIWYQPKKVVLTDDTSEKETIFSFQHPIGKYHMGSESEMDVSDTVLVKEQVSLPRSHSRTSAYSGNGGAQSPHRPHPPNRIPSWTRTTYR